MKVNKETIIGLVKALEIYLSQDFNAEMEKWSKQVDYWVKSLSELPCMSITRGFPTLSVHGMGPDCIPKAYIVWDEEKRGFKKDQVVDMLKKGNPGISVNPWPKRGIALNPQMLREGEEKVVARRSIEIFLGINGE